ncbi:MAG: hypothetical protein Q8900_00415 [Bacillota bacterium]|nr:hypothetical protein [Bacillota bacterium]
MNELINLLYKIKERPGMYIGCKSLTSLADFVNGYLLAKHEDGINIEFFDGFNKWIAEKYSIKSTHDWSRIISFYYLSPESAFDKFYEHLEEFLEEN